MSGEFDEIMQLATDLGQAGNGIAVPLGKALGVTAGRIKTDAQKTVRQRKGLGHAASAISYDLEGVEGRVSSMSAEIGYEKNGAGNLGNLIEFGAPASDNSLAPSHDLGNALLNNEDDFIRGTRKAVDDALRAEDL